MCKRVKRPLRSSTHWTDWRSIFFWPDPRNTINRTISWSKLVENIGRSIAEFSRGTPTPAMRRQPLDVIDNVGFALAAVKRENCSRDGDYVDRESHFSTLHRSPNWEAEIVSRFLWILQIHNIQNCCILIIYFIILFHEDRYFFAPSENRYHYAYNQIRW